jgi:hypothetical protein
VRSYLGGTDPCMVLNSLRGILRAAVQQIGIPACVACRKYPQRMRITSVYCGTPCEQRAAQSRLEEHRHKELEHLRTGPPVVAGSTSYVTDRIWQHRN